MRKKKNEKKPGKSIQLKKKEEKKKKKKGKEENITRLADVVVDANDYLWLTPLRRQQGLVIKCAPQKDRCKSKSMVWYGILWYTRYRIARTYLWVARACRARTGRERGRSGRSHRNGYR